MVRNVSRILDGHAGRKPFELTVDGDLLIVIEKMILQRGVGFLRSRVMRMMTLLLGQG